MIYGRFKKERRRCDDADPTIPGTINEWLDQFEMFSSYEVLPENLELWGSNLFTDGIC